MLLPAKGSEHEAHADYCRKNLRESWSGAGMSLSHEPRLREMPIRGMIHNWEENTFLTMRSMLFDAMSMHVPSETLSCTTWGFGPELAEAKLQGGGGTA